MMPKLRLALRSTWPKRKGLDFEAPAERNDDSALKIELLDEINNPQRRTNHCLRLVNRELRGGSTTDTAADAAAARRINYRPRGERSGPTDSGCQHLARRVGRLHGPPRQH